MDFTLSDDQRAVIELADRILSEQLPPERLKAIEAGAEPWPSDVWAEFARADLLGLCLPEADGGGGYGFLELALLLESVGRATAPIPLLETLVMGALPIAHHGSDEQRATLLPGVVAGEIVLTTALGEAGRPLPPERPATTASRVDGGWELTGTKTFVRAAGLAHRILVPATTDEGVTVFLVDPAVEGVELVANRSVNAEPLHTVVLENARVPDTAVLGEVGDGSEIVAEIRRATTAGICAVQAGVCEAATRLTGTYASERKQFGAPIATFQAVAHRVADAYIDTEGVRLSARRAAWALDAGIDAGEMVDVAGFWAADGSHRVVHAAQHVHGGIGVDTDYPVHRLYRWAKHLEFILGHGTDHLRSLGRQLAASATGGSDGDRAATP